MKTINYESDFKLVEGFKDGSPINNAPFRFTYYTKVSRGVYVAEYNGSEYVNCIPTEDGRVIVPFDSPKLGMGQLMVKREFFLNDADFADGVCNLVSVESTGITLDKGATDDMGEINIEVFPFYQQGEAGKSAYDLWLEQGNEGSVQDFLNSFKGEKGDKGDKGADGERGEQGIQGIQGEKGDKGDKMTYDDLTEDEKEDLAGHFKLDVVNNLEEGGEDKALSAEMGKFLNEKIATIVAGNTTEPIKFKGYVNVDNKNGIDTMFGLLNDGEACLVAPSVNTGNGDSYKTWIASAINGTGITLGSDLFKTSHNISAANIALGRLEVKTYLKLDENQPYCQCPDMILLCKVKVKAKDFIGFIDGISETVANLIPSSMMLTACIGKVLRWSAGDWVAENQALLERGIVKNYPYQHNIDSAIQTGVISYTDNQGHSGDSWIGVGGWYTVFVNASADVDSGGAYVVSQTAYGRNGEAANRVFTRLLFVKNDAISDKTSWVEITKNTNILPNVNGWLLESSELLATGVYQTCDTRYRHYTTVVNAEGKEQIISEWRSIGELTNNYCTLFVNASTSPNGDGYDAIEQTAYGREADAGKIYRRVIFYHKANNIKQYGEWIKLDVNNLYKALGYLTEEYFPSTYTTKDEVATAIANAITNTLNTEV